MSRSSVLVVVLAAFAPTCGGAHDSAPPSDTHGHSDSSSSASDSSSAEESGSSSTDDGEPEPTIEVLELAYGDDPAQTLDLYLLQPRPAAPVATVVLAHGGLWQAGDKLALAFLCESLVETSRGQLACASVNYRLSQSLGGVCRGAGVDTYVQQVHDLASAYALLQAQARAHQLDRSRMFVGGHSAGGQLAHTLNLRWSEFSAACPDGCAAPAGAIGIEGIYDVAAWDAYDAQYWNGAFACATRKAFGGSPDSPTPCSDAVHQRPCWEMGSPTVLAQQSVALGLAPVGDALIIHSPGDDWVDLAEAPNFAAAMSTAFPDLGVIASYDGTCGNSTHDNVLGEPALASCIINFIASNGASI